MNGNGNLHTPRRAMPESRLIANPFSPAADMAGRPGDCLGVPGKPVPVRRAALSASVPIDKAAAFRRRR